MSASGLPSTLITSASLPGSRLPASLPIPMASAARRVPARIASCGSAPHSTTLAISHHISPCIESVPSAHFTPLSSTA